MANCGCAVRMRPYASRHGSPDRGVSPVMKKLGLTVSLVGHVPQRCDLLPVVVFSEYAGAVAAASLRSQLKTFLFVASGYWRVARPCEKNAALPQKSYR